MLKNDGNFVFIEQFLISQLRICLKIWDTSQMSLSWKTPIICCYSLFWKWKRGQIWIIWVIATIWNYPHETYLYKKSNILDDIIFNCDYIPEFIIETDLLKFATGPGQNLY